MSDTSDSPSAVAPLAATDAAFVRFGRAIAFVVDGGVALYTLVGAALFAVNMAMSMNTPEYAMEAGMLGVFAPEFVAMACAIAFLEALQILPKAAGSASLGLDAVGLGAASTRGTEPVVGWRRRILRWFPAVVVLLLAGYRYGTIGTVSDSSVMPGAVMSMLAAFTVASVLVFLADAIAVASNPSAITIGDRLAASVVRLSADGESRVVERACTAVVPALLAIGAVKLLAGFVGPRPPLPELGEIAWSDAGFGFLERASALSGTVGTALWAGVWVCANRRSLARSGRSPWLEALLVVLPAVSFVVLRRRVRELLRDADLEPHETNRWILTFDAMALLWTLGQLLAPVINGLTYAGVADPLDPAGAVPWPLLVVACNGASYVAMAAVVRRLPSMLELLDRTDRTVAADVAATFE